MNDEIVVTMTHVLDAGMCARGARAWFDRYGLDFREFLVNGLPISAIEGTKDQLGLMVCEIARKGDEA